MPRDRTEWTLLKHGAAALRPLLDLRDVDTRICAAQTLAWLGDGQSRSALQHMAQSDPERSDLYQWCLHKLDEIERLRHGSL